MRSPLHVACISGRLSVGEALLNSKADVEAQEEQKLTPLAVASQSGLTGVVEVLLQHKASTRARSLGDFTPLHWAGYYGHEEAAEILIRDKKTEIDACSINGRTPLHLAAMGRSFGVIEKLLNAGANIEAQCHEKYRPLHYACVHATNSEVSLLVNSSADCNAQTATGETPLHLATKAGSAKVVRTLLSRGACVDRIDGLGTRPLAIACSNGNVEIVELLLDNGALLRGLGSQTRALDAPVCIAASGGHVQVIQTLIRRGGAVREEDTGNWQPLRHAAYVGHVEALACLLGNGSRASDLGPLASLSFSSAVTPERRERIMTLLDNAIQTENMEYQRVTYLASAASPANPADAPTELPLNSLEAGDRSQLPVTSLLSQSTATSGSQSQDTRTAPASLQQDTSARYISSINAADSVPISDSWLSSTTTPSYQPPLVSPEPSGRYGGVSLQPPTSFVSPMHSVIDRIPPPAAYGSQPSSTSLSTDSASYTRGAPSVVSAANTFSAPSVVSAPSVLSRPSTLSPQYYPPTVASQSRLPYPYPYPIPHMSDQNRPDGVSATLYEARRGTDQNRAELG
jgi:ankyrin repeat protein